MISVSAANFLLRAKGETVGRQRLAPHRRAGGRPIGDCDDDAPPAAPNEFVNTLDPSIELYDGAGTLLAANDNGAADQRNATITYTATQFGQLLYPRARRAGFARRIRADRDRRNRRTAAVYGHCRKPGRWQASQSVARNLHGQLQRLRVGHKSSKLGPAHQRRRQHGEHRAELHRRQDRRLHASPSNLAAGTYSITINAGLDLGYPEHVAAGICRNVRDRHDRAAGYGKFDPGRRFESRGRPHL